MSKKKLCFWCDSCSKKFFLESTDELVEVPKSILQRKVPFIDHDNKNKKTKPVYVERKPVLKCANCGFLLKRIQNENGNNTP